MRGNGFGRPVVAVDIDGTLADYHEYFIDFCKRYWGRAFPNPSLNNEGQPFNEFLGLTKAEYQETKLAYRQGGMKRSMPVLQDAKKLIDCIRTPKGQPCEWGHGLGCQVWICTTRPYLRLDNIDPDTRHWLARSEIQFDGLIFDPLDGDHKYRELMRPEQAGGRVVCAIEDLPEQADMAIEEGVPAVFLRSRPYNQYYMKRAEVEKPVRFWERAKQVYHMVDLQLRTFEFEQREKGKNGAEG